MTNFFPLMVVGAALAFVAGGVFMKASDGLRLMWPTLAFLACFLIGAASQGLAMRGEEMGGTYLVIVGLECILALGCGAVLFKERLTPDNVLGVGLVMAGILLLRAASATSG